MGNNLGVFSGLLQLTETSLKREELSQPVAFWVFYIAWSTNSLGTQHSISLCLERVTQSFRGGKRKDGWLQRGTACRTDKCQCGDVILMQSFWKLGKLSLWQLVQRLTVAKCWSSCLSMENLGKKRLYVPGMSFWSQKMCLVSHGLCQHL